MDSFRGRTIDLQVFLLSITVHLLSFPSFGWRTNVKLSCGRAKPDRQIQFLVRRPLFATIAHGAGSRLARKVIHMKLLLVS